jgi:hypothetical protein
MKRRHDHEDIAARRSRGESWDEIAAAFGTTANSARSSHYRWAASSPAAAADAPAEEQAAGQAREIEALLTVDDVARITSLEDLLSFFKVDTDRWQVSTFKVNKWEQASVDRKTGDTRVTPLYQVKATLVQSFSDQAAELGLIWDDILADLHANAPAAPPAPAVTPASLVDDEPCLFELAMVDAHIGMLAWGRETGEAYDTDIAVRDYAAAVRNLLGFARLYPIERVLFLAGNDYLHVDAAGLSTRGGTTAAGTPQDVDSRLARMFSAARRALVAAIEEARALAPVDVLFVPGNHDQQQTYRLGEVVSAWFRNDPDVRVIYGPSKRSYYGYGANAFMFTHGEEYRRKRDSLPLIFATECPAELWVAASHREIHTGHNHIKLEGRYTPTSDVDETRGIRTRSLPGLTAGDAWHVNEGYRHRRTATALVFRSSGGIAGLHEFNP